MNFNYDELYFFNIGPGWLLPSKLGHAKGQDPVEWMNNELKNKPAKVICNGQVIGEAKGYDPKTEILDIVYYEKPVPALTEADWDEWAKINGDE